MGFLGEGYINLVYRGEAMMLDLLLSIWECLQTPRLQLHYAAQTHSEETSA